MAPPSTMRRKKLKKPSKAKANRKVNPQPLLNKPLLEHGLIEYRPSSRGPFTTYAMRHSSSHTHPGAPSPPGRGVLHYLEIIMSNIQIVDLPALPEVEEVCLSDIEDELLLSRHFCNFAWLFLASNNAQVSALA